MKRAVLIAVAVLLLAVTSGFVVSRIDLAPSISESLSACFNTEVSDACLKSTARSLLTRMSTQELMDYIVASTSPAMIVGQCHVISHAIGQETYIKSGSLEDTLAACTSQCAYGCTHGAIAAEVAHELGETYPGEEVEHADETELKNIGRHYCDRSHSMCHAIGHIARIASDTLLDTLKLCDAVSENRRARTCYQGAFMEDIGHIAFAPKKVEVSYSDYGYPCNTLPAKYLGGCYIQLHEYQKILFEERKVPLAERHEIAAAVCDALSGTAREQCFFGFGYKRDHAFKRDGTQENIGRELCDALKGNDAIACADGLAENYGAFAKYDNVIGLCDSRTNESRIQECYDHAFSTMGMSAERMRTMCTKYTDSHCRASLEIFLARGTTILPVEADE